MSPVPKIKVDFFIICSKLIKAIGYDKENDTLRKKNIFLLFYDIFYAKIILYKHFINKFNL